MMLPYIKWDAALPGTGARYLIVSVPSESELSC